jgi:hypothetical protein
MKLYYDMSEADDYVDIWVHCSVGKREWEMHLYRDKETLAISAPMYQYSPNVQTTFEEVTRLPKRVQRYFDAALPQAKTLLILGSN